MTARAQRDLLTACEVVQHELAHGPAGDGDRPDLSWCANLLGGAIANARNKPTYAGRGSSDTATPSVSTGEPTATSAAAPAITPDEESGQCR